MGLGVCNNFPTLTAELRTLRLGRCPIKAQEWKNLRERKAHLEVPDGCLWVLQVIAAPWVLAIALFPQTTWWGPSIYLWGGSKTKCRVWGPIGLRKTLHW